MTAGPNDQDISLDADEIARLTAELSALEAGLPPGIAAGAVSADLRLNGDAPITAVPTVPSPASALASQHPTSLSPVQFSTLSPQSAVNGDNALDLLMDVLLNVSVELGQTRLAVKELLALGPGAIVELDKLAGEPVDILVNGTLLAHGEVVVVDEKFGVRVTEVVSSGRRPPGIP